MFYELIVQRFNCETEKPVKVLQVGKYRADIIVENIVILELKASES